MFRAKTGIDSCRFAGIPAKITNYVDTYAQWVFQAGTKIYGS
jgi:hypothetical protein